MMGSGDNYNYTRAQIFNERTRSGYYKMQKKYEKEIKELKTKLEDKRKI